VAPQTYGTPSRLRAAAIAAAAVALGGLVELPVSMTPPAALTALSLAGEQAQHLRSSGLPGDLKLGDLPRDRGVVRLDRVRAGQGRGGGLLAPLVEVDDVSGEPEAVDRGGRTLPGQQRGHDGRVSAALVERTRPVGDGLLGTGCGGLHRAHPLVGLTLLRDGDAELALGGVVPFGGNFCLGLEAVDRLRQRGRSRSGVRQRIGLRVRQSDSR
jgi:hypothetical protein